MRAILRNPKYTGRQVWGRRHRGRLVSPERWVWSPAWVHLPLITDEEFVAANPSSEWAGMPHAGSAGGDAARSDRRQGL
ncbi:recombinase family protein [Amycolatopsis sp. NPDC024027]|uniref:recombinase family protein n=1 Tax=Amycolatopsis sp. NPDC024027 TaxID=3154327 RepID=UPI0033FAA57C